MLFSVKNVIYRVICFLVGESYKNEFQLKIKKNNVHGETELKLFDIKITMCDNWTKSFSFFSMLIFTTAGSQ